MKTEKNIFIAFILNLAFGIFEMVGGILTGSVAILSDSIHDIGDASSIGISFFLEKKSKRGSDNKYTYGYARFSTLASLIMTVILTLGSIFVIYNAIKRIINPVQINYNGMIIFAIVGVVVNFFAAYFTSRGNSLNQKAVNLHMLEDVFGWLIVLIGAIIMRFTNFAILDSVLSIIVAVFILVNAIKGIVMVSNIFLEKTPKGICLHHLEETIKNIEGVEDVHHIHITSIDGVYNKASMHLVISGNANKIKHQVRECLNHNFKVVHSTLETEELGEECNHKHCHIKISNEAGCGHHHHHHH